MNSAPAACWTCLVRNSAKFLSQSNSYLRKHVVVLEEGRPVPALRESASGSMSIREGTHRISAMLMITTALKIGMELFIAAKKNLREKRSAAKQAGDAGVTPYIMTITKDTKMRRPRALKMASAPTRRSPFAAMM